MAFNLIAEFRTQEPEWAALALRAASLKHVECFPIEALGSQPHALGISVPGKAANEQGWKELESLLAQLRTVHRADVIELYGGTLVTPASEESLHQALVG